MNDNFSLDPLFCLESNPVAPFTLHVGSLCLSENSPCGQLVGAYGSGCAAITVVRATSWSEIKGRTGSGGTRPSASPERRETGSPSAGLSLGRHDVPSARTRALPVDALHTDYLSMTIFLVAANPGAVMR
jgi:hypothetical protein